jgi:phosphomannomutase/phosphoglucomutase
MAAGTQAREQGARSIVVGRDGRLSSVELAAALQAGLRSAGMHVIDIGMATTPMVYFATRLMDTGAGIAVTGSHNPPAHNGFKIVLDGASLYGEGITALRDAMRLPIESASASGGRTQMQIMPCYTARLMGDIRMARPMKIATSTLVNPLENYKRQRRAFRSSRLRLGHCACWPVPRASRPTTWP